MSSKYPRAGWAEMISEEMEKNGPSENLMPGSLVNDTDWTW